MQKLPVPIYYVKAFVVTATTIADEAAATAAEAFLIM